MVFELNAGVWNVELVEIRFPPVVASNHWYESAVVPMDMVAIFPVQILVELTEGALGIVFIKTVTGVLGPVQFKSVVSTK